MERSSAPPRQQEARLHCGDARLIFGGRCGISQVTRKKQQPPTDHL
jgi:hypothetical protein